MKTRPIHVDDDTYTKIKTKSTEEKITIGEAARQLIHREPLIEAPGTKLTLPAELKARVEAYCISEGLDFNDALLNLLKVGMNRVTTLNKWIEKNKAARLAKRTPDLLE